MPTEVKETIYRLAHVTHRPVKDVCESLVCTVLREKQTLDVLSRYFKRSITIDNTYYRGDINTTAIEKRLQTPTGLVSVKFKSFDFELISAIAYGLDCSPTRTCSILLEVAVKNIKVVNEFIRSYMVEELTEGQMMELRKILTFVNGGTVIIVHGYPYYQPLSVTYGQLQRSWLILFRSF